MTQRIAILGAGSIGCFIGGAWLAGGLDVTLIGRKKTAEAIASHGLRITDHDGLDVTLAADAVPFFTSADALADADLVVVAVKSTATRKAGEEIALHAPPGATVLSLQNGISNVDMLAAVLPGRRVLRGMVGFNVARIGPSRFHRGTSGLLTGQRDEALAGLAAASANTAAPLELVDDAVAIAWGKLLLNLNNAVNALSGKTLLEELSGRAYRRVLAATIREALDVLAAAGIRPAKVGPLPPRLLPTFIDSPNFLFNTIGLWLQKIDAEARSSMVDDFIIRRPTEIDYLNGEIVRLAEEAGVSAPVNSRLVTLVRQAEAGGRANWPGEELEEIVLGPGRDRA